jgi:hypothetical protein
VVEEEPLGDVSKPGDVRADLDPVVEEEPLGDVSKPGDVRADLDRRGFRDAR